MTRLTTIVRASVLLAVASGILAATPPAFAAGNEDVPQAKLNVAGVDFTSPKAVAHLKTEVRHTALEVCGYDWTDKGAMSIDTRKCYDAALQGGFAQIDSKQQQALRDNAVKMASAQPQDRRTH